MHKIEKVKTVLGEIEVYQGSAIFVDFKKQFGENVQSYFKGKDDEDEKTDNSENIEALAFIAFKGYQCACSIKRAELEFDFESFLALSIGELVEVFQKIFPTPTALPQKKTK